MRIKPQYLSIIWVACLLVVLPRLSFGEGDNILSESHLIGDHKGEENETITKHQIPAISVSGTVNQS